MEITNVVDNVEKNPKETSTIKYTIKHRRWVVLRDEKDILCGFPKYYFFCDINENPPEPVILYRSKESALCSIRNRFKLPKNIEITDGIRIGAHTYSTVRVTQRVQIKLKKNKGVTNEDI